MTFFYFHAHTLFLQEGFIKYADVHIEGLKKRRDSQNQRSGEQQSFVSMATAVGAVGIGALVAYSISQALS